MLALVFFLLYFGAANAAAPIHTLIDQINKPRSISQSSKDLPPNIQQAIEIQAQQEIKQEQANALLATNTSGQSSKNTIIANSLNTTQAIQEEPILQSLADTIQEITTTNPSIRAKIKLKRIDGLIAKVQNLLATDRSDAAINQAISLIQQIGEQTAQIATDAKVQTDREILSLQIEQYNRLQLILQKREEQLPLDAYLKVDDAREKYLVSGAIASLNAAPNLNAINNIALKEVTKFVGDDFAPLKAIEILTDIKSGLKPEARQKVTGLEKQLALQFEKKIVTLSPDVRTRKLQQFIAFSYGNPINQVKALDTIQDSLRDRDLILNIESLETLNLRQLENRFLSIQDPQTNTAFLKMSLRTPEDLKVFAQMQLDVQSSGDQKKIGQFTKQIANSQQTIIDLFDTNSNLDTYFGGENSGNGDLLDISVASQLADILNNASSVSPSVKEKITAIKKKTLREFITKISQNGFVTQPKIGYNPVSENADVRILLPSPSALTLLEKLASEVSNQDATKIVTARKANARIVANHLLLQVNDPETFRQYSQFITDNFQIKQLIQANAGDNFFTLLTQKKQVIDKQNKANDQQLYEKMQQLVQSIFVAKDPTPFEQELPTTIQQEITKLKDELPDRTVPKLDTPADVKLSEVATLPQEVQDALILAAKEKIGSVTNNNTIDAATEAKELGVSVPLILPDNPLYSLVELERKIVLLITTDPIARAEELIKQDNEKTIEAAKLVEESKSTTSIETALQTLNSVSKDFDLLEQHVDEIKQIEQTQPEQVDKLVTQVIENGIARQTVLSEIENNIHGDVYIEAETIRQDILQDGVDTLLKVTDNNVPALINKLEHAVTDTATPATTIASDIKAVEMLNEIARTQPESVQTIVQTSEASIAERLEKVLLTEPVEQRQQEIVTYAEEATGNPVRQLEAYDILKDTFTNPQTILLTEELKDKATQNLTDRISEIPDANTQAVFAEQIIGSQPQDLKAIIQIEEEVAPPQNAGIIEVLPIVQKVEDIKANIEQNIVEEFKDNPGELKNADFFDNPTLSKTPDVVDIQVAQDVITALQTSPEVQPEVITVAKQEETKLINTFVENISSPGFYVSANISTNTTTTPLRNSNETSVSAQTNVTQLAAETLNPIPETLTTLVNLKEGLPPLEREKIDIAITAEVHMIQEHLVNDVTDPTTFQTYVAQITENPTVAAIVEQIGGQTFQQAIEEKTQTIEQQVTQEQSQLATTVEQVQQEVFSAPLSSPSTAEQSLPQPIQEEIQQIKQEVPTAQIPSVNVATETSVSTTVEAQPVNTTPIAAPIVEQQQVSQPTVPQTAAPAPATTPAESAPQTTAPSVPGL